MNTFSLVVTRDECDRYLEACLDWHVPMFDAVLVYDDHSTDDTFNVVARSGGAAYTKRPDAVPPFMQHEGYFRQDSLDALEVLFEPQEGDWIVVIDTDEFLVTEEGDRFKALKEIAADAEKVKAKGVLIPRPELWKLDPPMTRIDGFWGGITCTRMFRWQPGGRIADKAMGCGNEPTYVSSAKIYRGPHTLKLLHVGYVEEEDRQDKYERYNSIQHGHNDKHIQSILKEPDLLRYRGPMPAIWRGVRKG